ncbi:GTP-binding protein [Caldibacillus lycopersici]|uniref:GTP-binding protein n=1 Tax=Perspicuibacillus lycopersici TaxID=1325689 RepID=A0AAE3ISZ9_9BACI|nr:GTP-binding protein [Perspicuibacillus lycopersici]MCU9612891.1 GTP-binding protein [Perspicuibacillus lycopersici]
MGKIPVYIISGFLGSGKTTVLLNMIKQFEVNNRRPGIILNELGEVNVEGHLFNKREVKELLNGCICCTIQDDLKETLNYFMGLNTVDVLLIEGTGVANPLEIEETLLSPEYLNVFELYSIISLVDASHFLEYQSIFSSTSEIRQLLKEQISTASMVVLNKMDLVNTKTLGKIEQKIEDMGKQQVPIYQTSFGEIPIEELLEKRYWVQTMDDEIVENRKDRHDHSHGHDHNHHHSTINAIKISQFPEMVQKELEQWLKRLPKNVLRGKGIIRLVGKKGLFQLQFASGKVQFEKMGDDSSMEPTIILIGDQLDITELHTSFRATFNQ